MSNSTHIFSYLSQFLTPCNSSMIGSPVFWIWIKVIPEEHHKNTDAQYNWTNTQLTCLLSLLFFSPTPAFLISLRLSNRSYRITLLFRGINRPRFIFLLYFILIFTSYSLLLTLRGNWQQRKITPGAEYIIREGPQRKNKPFHYVCYQNVWGLWWYWQSYHTLIQMATRSSTSFLEDRQ